MRVLGNYSIFFSVAILAGRTSGFVAQKGQSSSRVSALASLNDPNNNHDEARRSFMISGAIATMAFLPSLANAAESKVRFFHEAFLDDGIFPIKLV